MWAKLGMDYRRIKRHCVWQDPYHSFDIIKPTNKLSLCYFHYDPIDYFNQYGYYNHTDYIDRNGHRGCYA